MSKFSFFNDQRRKGRDEWLYVGFRTGGGMSDQHSLSKQRDACFNIPGRIATCTALVICFSEAAGSFKLIDTKREAHGLIPAMLFYFKLIAPASMLASNTFITSWSFTVP